MPRPTSLVSRLGSAGKLVQSPNATHRPLRLPGQRHASTFQSAPRRFLSTTLIVGGSVALIAYYYDSRSLLHEHVIMPVMRLFDPETGHRLAVRLLSGPKWTRPRDRGVDGPELKTELFGLPLVNPVGIAAGFDKDAQAIDGLFDLGFGYVEIGSVTPEPQPGNPEPRFFRLSEDQAAINRYGFNSLGHGHALGKLRARVYAFARSNPSYFPSSHSSSSSIPLPPSDLPRSLRPGHILAVNLGKNKTSAADSNEDYIKGVKMLGPYADVLVINVSSPNTPGLRALQGRQVLERLLKDVVEERNKIKDERGLPKVAVKVACDLGEEELGDVALAVRRTGIDGIIVSNTTIRREGLGLRSSNQSQIGGLSGKPLFPYALEAVTTLRSLLPPEIPIIGCGGISTGADAVKMAQAGASIVQIYTSFGFRGVGTPRLLKDEISAKLSEGSSKGWHDLVESRTRSTTWVDPLKSGLETLKREAQGLGEMLRRMNEEDDTRRLMKEAEAALSESSKVAEAQLVTEEAEGGPTPASDTQAKLLEEEQNTEPLPVDGPILVLTDGSAADRPAEATSEDPEMPPLSENLEGRDGEAEHWRNTVTSGDRRLV
ncbi:hypothetical protein BD324DRAFT_588950 [Kockovaella imperatae]|uniref:Dihydroorotate dehydrogenase (quinone), mitochondrial n=1 Tax=Kockovaella imperatae TaxID=4999 RepID=A0A1Y1UM09_9TREE|nr:hypothetical protein BD324DRAFT_588950 [Kockovaella imperatae]ORX38524.1 hypothetical protein BD324DRAFT_588950 [Kockovaella imperatae]